MGFSNPRMPWAEIERRLSDPPLVRPGRAVQGDGNDSPAWSRRRGSYRPPPGLAYRPAEVPYAELHCHSNYSFLDGASSPEELVEEAVRLGLSALALTDHDGLYAAVRFAEAARALGLPAVFGAELSIGLRSSRGGWADPEGRHLLVLARSPEGWRRLARAISDAHLAGGEKGRPLYDLDRLAATAGGEWLWLTGCRKGLVPAALIESGPAAARRELSRLAALAGGRDNVAVELWDHGDPTDGARNDALAEIALSAGIACVATNNVHYHVPARRRLATAVAAVRARRPLEEMDGWLPPAATAHLRSGAEQARWLRRYPGVVEKAAELAEACSFSLDLIAPRLPRFPCPDGFNEESWLRRLVAEGARRRYGEGRKEVEARLERELGLICALGWPGYFLIVHDVVELCRRRGIYVQGRGSAVGSAVCYVLGITNADPVAYGLLFERFLSPERGAEPPDIDLDIESRRREEVIQYLYERYGRLCCAQVANVITYRARSAVRDMAKALGASPVQADRWAKQAERGPLSATASLPAGSCDIPPLVLSLAGELEHAPRHLGVHSGGMVLADRPIAEVCPIEWARAEGRSVLQWDKDDCEAAGLVKIDLLGLGMLTALHETIELVNAHYDASVELAAIPGEDPAVYDMLCAPDSVGVFQVESRAQLQTAPRMQPRNIYDLAVQIAIIRPGPIQGDSVHPYLRRRRGEEPVTYLHPLLEPILERTLGIPLFQEQLMEIARVAGGFSAGEADQLRRAMGSKRSRERMEQLRRRLFEGMAERGITGEVAERLWAKLAAFSDYGFPESHALAFAYLAYASAWLKRFYPAAFCAGLLNAQPMGFYSPHSLVQDARRHGVEVLTPDLNVSGVGATLEPGCAPPSAGFPPAPSARGGAGGSTASSGAITPLLRSSRAPGPTARPSAGFPPAPREAPPALWGAAGPAVRLGLSCVRTLGKGLAERLVDEREAGGPYSSMEDLVRRVPELTRPQLEALAMAGAFGCFGIERRAALWMVGAVAQGRPGRLPGMLTGAAAPELPVMTPMQLAYADLWATAVSPDGHPTRFVRKRLDSLGVVAAERLASVADGARVAVAGLVTHKQRPATAGGVTFLNLEDETGMVNVICSPGCWARHRRVLAHSPALLVRGRLQSTGGALNVVAEQVETLALAGAGRSRDFR